MKTSDHTLPFVLIRLWADATPYAGSNGKPFSGCMATAEYIYHMKFPLVMFHYIFRFLYSNRTPSGFRVVVLHGVDILVGAVLLLYDCPPFLLIPFVAAIVDSSSHHRCSFN